MNVNPREGTFIPCGDSMEKIVEIDDSALESVSGGVSPVLRCALCPTCGRVCEPYDDGTKYIYSCCNTTFSVKK